MNQYMVHYVETEEIGKTNEAVVYTMIISGGTIETALAFARYDLPEYYTVVAVTDERFTRGTV